jgi:hypothetical protein
MAADHQGVPAPFDTVTAHAESATLHRHLPHGLGRPRRPIEGVSRPFLTPVVRHQGL